MTRTAHRPDIVLRIAAAVGDGHDMMTNQCNASLQAALTDSAARQSGRAGWALVDVLDFRQPVVKLMTLAALDAAACSGFLRGARFKNKQRPGLTCAWRMRRLACNKILEVQRFKDEVLSVLVKTIQVNIKGGRNWGGMIHSGTPMRLESTATAVKQMAANLGSDTVP